MPSPGIPSLDRSKRAADVMTTDRLGSFRSRRLSHPWLWPAAVVLISLIPVRGAFSTTQIFFVRDLSLFLWPRHLWLRQVVFEGRFPFWDPYPAAGQATAGDAVYQFFLPPALLIRLLSPEVLGFNLWVAAPFPLVAFGGYLFFRRRFSPSSAALGALAFALSGPVVSSGTFGTMSWTVAFLPWVFWSVERALEQPSGARFALAAGMVAMQCVAGEPVTWAATGAVTFGYAVSVTSAGARAHARIRAGLLTIGSIVVGALLAAVQLAPMLQAGLRSSRGRTESTLFWSLHPLFALETIVPQLFGDHYTGQPTSFPWMGALNGDREPFFSSIYIGVGVVAMALFGAFIPGARAWRRYWALVVLVSLIAAFGMYTPVYPALQDLIPVTQRFRFPVKYLAITAFGLAALVAAGWSAIERHRPDDSRPLASRVATGALLALGAAAAALVVTALEFPLRWLTSAAALADLVGVEHPWWGGEYLLFASPPLMVGLALLATGSALLIALATSGRPEAAAARAALFALIVVEVAASTARLNPTLPSDVLRAPSWLQATRVHPDDRVYVGARIEIPDRDGELLDGPHDVEPPVTYSAVETRSVVHNEYAMTPSPWRVREAVSFDLPALWPREYTRALLQFGAVGPENRQLFLRRAGVRYCVMSGAPAPGFEPLLALPMFPDMALYECNPNPVRVSVVPEAWVLPVLWRQSAKLVDPRFDEARTALIEQEPPPPSGRPGPPQEPSATIVRETERDVLVRAAANAGGGYLVLRDSYDSDWAVEVDGRAAPLLRANALFRGVRLAPGEHLVRFRYTPRALVAGAIVSGLTLFGLAMACVAERRRARAVHRAPAPRLAETV